MKLRLSIILLAAALAASPAAGQTIKSLGFNTTNGQVVYSGTNPLTFTNSLQFATNARAATRTNLGGTTVGNSVFTATNAAAAATAIGLGAANTASFDSLIIGAGSGDPLNVDFYRIESSSFNFLFDWEEKRLAQGGNDIFSWNSTNATFPVPVSFSTNVTVNGNATLNGVDNLAPSQTASSGASLMTRDLSDDRYFNQPNLQRINVNNFTGAVVGGYSPGQLTGLLNAQGQTLANTVTNSFAKMGQFPAVIGGRTSFNFSTKMRVKVDFMVVATAGSFSNSSVHYIVPTVSGYNAGFPAHRSFGFAVSGDTIKGFTHNGTNYVTTTNSVTWTNQHRYLGVVENDGGGNYSFWVNSGGTFNSLGTIAGPTGAHTAEYVFGANVASTNTDDANGYYIVRSLDLALTP